MSTTPADPLARALAALNRLHAPGLPPEGADAWQQVRTALAEAQQEREALMAVAQEARDLVDAIDGYEEAIEAGKKRLIDSLGDACVEAEDALVDALNRLHEIQASRAEPSTEDVRLAALDRFASDDDDDEEPK